MIKARASGSKVNLYFMKKGRQARHRIPRNSCFFFYYFRFLKENEIALLPDVAYMDLFVEDFVFAYF